MRLYQNYWMKEIEDAVQKLYVPRLQDPSGAAFDAELLHAPIIVNMAAEEEDTENGSHDEGIGTEVDEVNSPFSRLSLTKGNTKEGQRDHVRKEGKEERLCENKKDQVMVDQDKLPEGTRVVKVEMTSQVDFKISRKDDALAAKGETGAQISPDQAAAMDDAESLHDGGGLF
ncbi:hypothetical protein AK812_SmicGene16322 [Symbiodinium microadriaticum]|uniref:Uncharacterized protein n=1 Tax=Symbiodinium microadriaticum TaxID=2951 RepID=A0A1Q9E0L3_SYMMI|nr:hypothetical protein AK812_SmicGene16322 [Symbiodinium microadriaticum]